jgi:predicted  nucleic acid-binding Zn-ribbon protein
MVTSIPNLEEIALQLETTTAQLRMLSAFPEAQRDGDLKSAVEEMNKNITAVEDQVKRLSSEVQSTRATTDNRLKSLEALYVPINFQTHSSRN